MQGLSASQLNQVESSQGWFMKRISSLLMVLILSLSFLAYPSFAWFDETHITIGKAAGYAKWFLAVGADMVKEKAPKIENHNHYVNNPEGTTITPETVLDQASRYDQHDHGGHLYGAIIASVRNYIKAKKAGKYAEYHLGFCLHYVGDLSQPLHSTLYNDFNKKNHLAFDGIVNDEIMENMDRIKIYPIAIDSEEALAKEIARVANFSMQLGYRLQKENRLLTKDEAYEQLGHSASLFKSILTYVNAQ